MNRFCECLQCDNIYLSEDAYGRGVSDEYVFTYCSKECETQGILEAQAKEQLWNSMDHTEHERLTSIATVPRNETKSSEKPKTILETMDAFLKSQGITE